MYIINSCYNLSYIVYTSLLYTLDYNRFRPTYPFHTINQFLTHKHDILIIYFIIICIYIF